MDSHIASFLNYQKLLKAIKESEEYPRLSDAKDENERIGIHIKQASHIDAAATLRAAFVQVSALEKCEEVMAKYIKYISVSLLAGAALVSGAIIFSDNGIAENRGGGVSCSVDFQKSAQGLQEDIDKCIQVARKTNADKVVFELKQMP